MIALLLTLFALAACGAQPAQPQPANPEPRPRVQPAEVTGVEVEIRESLPVQVVAVIDGGLGNGCMSLGEITQFRDGNTITVEINANHSGAEACTMIYQTFSERVQLEGEFAPGDYTLIVNGVEKEFAI
jgi:hypothetical protein